MSLAGGGLETGEYDLLVHQRRGNAMLQRKLCFVFRLRLNIVANVDGRPVGPCLDFPEPVHVRRQFQGSINGRMCVSAGRPRLDRRQVELPGLVRGSKHCFGVSIRAGGGKEAAGPFQNRRGAGEAMCRELGCHDPCFRGTAGMEVLAHRTGRNELPQPS